MPVVKQLPVCYVVKRFDCPSLETDRLRSSLFDSGFAKSIFSLTLLLLRRWVDLIEVLSVQMLLTVSCVWLIVSRISTL